jgi:hypothetical protein
LPQWFTPLTLLKENMDTTTILADLRAERDRISLAITAIEALNGTSGRKRPGRKAKVVPANVPLTAKKKGGLTAAGRRRLSENMRRRWAERKKNAKKARVVA